MSYDSYDIFQITLRGYGGRFRGASLIKFEGDAPRFIADAEWPALCLDINKGALAEIELQKQEIAQHLATIESLNAEVSSLKVTGVKAAQAVVTVVDDPNISPEQTAVKCKEIALEHLKKPHERELAAAIKAAFDAQQVVERLSQR